MRLGSKDQRRGGFVGDEHVQTTRPQSAPDRVALVAAGRHRDHGRYGFELLPLDGYRSPVETLERDSAVGSEEAAADIADRAVDYDAGAVGRFQMTVPHQRCLLAQRSDAEEGEFAAGGRLESRADRAFAREQLADLRRTDDEWSVQVMSVGGGIEPGQESQYLLCLNAWRRVAGPAVELRQLQARHSAGTQRTHHAQQGATPGRGDSHAVEEHAIDVVGCRRGESLASIRGVRHNHSRQAKMIGKFSTQVHVEGLRSGNTKLDQAAVASSLQIARYR